MQRTWIGSLVRETQFPHAVGQVNLSAATRVLVCCKEIPCMMQEVPACCNYDPMQPKQQQQQNVLLRLKKHGRLCCAGHEVGKVVETGSLYVSDR